MADVKLETTIGVSVCPYHSEMASDVKDVKRALFGENEDGLVAMVQETKGAWNTVKWLVGMFGGSVLVGLVFLFVNYVEAPYRYAKTEEVNRLVTQQALMTDKLGSMDDAFKDLTRELRRKNP